jgi:hypothetical protein
MLSGAFVGSHYNRNDKEKIMSKGVDSKKAVKKEPAKTPKEKKAENIIKKAEKKK